MNDTLFKICFLKEPNYFNRIIYGYEELEEYIGALPQEDYFIPNYDITFNPNDNVSTEIIINDCPFEPAYCLILDDEDNIVSRWFITETIFTRKLQYKHILKRDLIYDYKDKLMFSNVFVEKGWLLPGDPFIFNPEGMSYNQIKTSETLLKDNTDSGWVVGYIAKNAAPTDVSIQTKQETITDYITLSDLSSATGISEADLGSLFNVGTGQDIPAFFTDQIILTYGYSFEGVFFFGKSTTAYDSEISSVISGQVEARTSWNRTLYQIKNWIFGDESTVKAVLNANILAEGNNIKSQLPSIFDRPYFTSDQLSVLLKYNNKIIQYNGNFYKLQINEAGDDLTTVGPAVYSSFPGFSTAIYNASQDSDFQEKATFHPLGEISVSEKSKKVFINLVEGQPTTITPILYTKISSSRKTVQDQNFDMFAIPFGNIKIDGLNYNDETAGGLAVKIAAEIAKELDAACYDIQLLPYCPRIDIVSTDSDEKGISLDNLTEGEDFDYIQTKNEAVSDRVEMELSLTTPPLTFTASATNPNWPSDPDDVISIDLDIYKSPAGTYTITYDENTKTITVQMVATDYPPELTVYLDFKYISSAKNQSVILWCSTSSFSINLDYQLFNERGTYNPSESVKIDSEINKYRLCSPNYQGSFDFNVAKNGGQIDYFIADCTYKPYTPYIKIAPQFGLLYGGNFGDARGLICGGDYSLSRFTSAWENFELNNKNYQNIFNRDIQHLDFEHDLEYRKNIITGGINVLTGTFGGAAGGAMASGSPYGAVAGGLLGSAGAAVGLGLDIDMLVKEQREARQLAVDKYNYQLGNIKALPYTLTKVGAFNINSKIWPFLEYYTCSDEERTALINKLTYESMTVMRIDLFSKYWGIGYQQINIHEREAKKRYFKGHLIRNTDIKEDTHILEAITFELMKGVYI